MRRVMPQNKQIMQLFIYISHCTPCNLSLSTLCVSTISLFCLNLYTILPILYSISPVTLIHEIFYLFFFEILSVMASIGRSKLLHPHQNISYKKSECLQGT